MTTDSMPEILTKLEDCQLLQLTKYYRERLEQAVEEAVEGVSFVLIYERFFSNEQYQEILKLVENGSRMDASKLLLDLVMKSDSQDQRLIWQYFVKMQHILPKLDELLKEMQKLGSELSVMLKIQPSASDLPVHLKEHQNLGTPIFLAVEGAESRGDSVISTTKMDTDAQVKHKETLRARTEALRVKAMLMMETVKDFQLVDRYAELTVISTVRDLTLVEHELLARGREHEECREKHPRGELEIIRTDQLFQSISSQIESTSGSSVAVVGIPGIGKTTMVQKIVHDWARGKLYPHFQFVFSFKFRDLNSINSRTNLRELVLDQYPYLGNIRGDIWKNPEGLLFIFDGLDEFKHRIDFTDIQRQTKPQHKCTDPEDWCDVSDIVYSLIQHKLLPGCSVLVTTRSTALHLLEKAEIGVWAEIMGFVGEERREYFNRFFANQTVAAAVFKHVEENEILYTMTYNPSYCWILGLALGPFFTPRNRDLQRVPKTITQLYSYYIYNILENHGREIESPRDVLVKVGQMAFTEVAEKKIVFTDADLIEYNLQPSQFLSGFLLELLEREDSGQSVVYTFPHLTVQEFVAALAQFLTLETGDVLKHLNEAYSTADGRFEVFLRFVAGLSSSESARGLEEFLGPFIHQTTCRVIARVKEQVQHQIGRIASESSRINLLNTLHYLFESQNSGLAQETVGSVEKLSFRGVRLTPIDCAVVSHAVGLCDTIKHLDLWRCHIQCEGLQRLGPVLHKCHTLGLGCNNLRDSGMKLVSAALRNAACKIRVLWVDINQLTNSCAEDFASALRMNSSLTELQLGENGLGDLGVNLVSAALKDSRSKIQNLGLWSVGLTDSCAEDLTAALKAIDSLKRLHLGNNSFTDRSVPALRRLILTSQSLQWICLGANLFSRTGKKELESLRESRPGLSVTA